MTKNKAGNEEIILKMPDVVTHCEHGDSYNQSHAVMVGINLTFIEKVNKQMTQSNRESNKQSKMYETYHDWEVRDVGN